MNGFYFKPFLDMIYRINLIFLIPHFPEENEEIQSDSVGKLRNFFLIDPNMNSKNNPFLNYQRIFLPKADWFSSLSSRKRGG